MGFVTWANADNGDIPTWKMVDLDGDDHYLNPAAAAFFWAWDADFFALTGVHITISEAFRDIARQEDLYNEYLAGTGFMAAVPHTSSHGMGLAVDVNSWVYGNDGGTSLHATLVDSGHRHGWSWELVGKPSGEAWHFNYTGDPTLITVEQYNEQHNPKEEDDMPYTEDQMHDMIFKAVADVLHQPEFDRDADRLLVQQEVIGVLRGQEAKNIIHEVAQPGYVAPAQ